MPAIVRGEQRRAQLIALTRSRRRPTLDRGSSYGEVATPAIASEAAAYVFVCYAHEDEARVFPIVDWLQAQEVALWHDRGIEAGSLWRHEIATALTRASHVLFFVSGTCASSSLRMAARRSSWPKPSSTRRG